MVYCNRFNGPNTDNRHYTKDKPQAYINFYKSDCYEAVLTPSIKLKCAKDYTSKPWCNGTGVAAACSKSIGRSTLYHVNK